MGHASRLFNGAAEQTLYGRVTPTPQQREFLQEQWNDLATHLKGSLARHGYPISTWLQGSYKYGTLIRPVQYGEAYDVDVGVYFEWDPKDLDATPTAVQLRDWVQNELLVLKGLNPDIRMIEDPAKERCSRAVYKKQFHIDTPTYHLNTRTDTRRLACLSGNWEDSDPKAIYRWFKNKFDGGEREQLRRLIRYLKGWSAIAFQNSPASRPSSIVLTVLSTEAYGRIWMERLGGIDDDDALIEVVKVLHARLTKDRSVPNPVDDGEDLNRIPEDAWESFLARLTVLHDCALQAGASEDESAAALAWEQVFSFLMPLPETDAVEVTETSGRALMQIPDIRIQVFDKPGGTLLSTHLNEVPSVHKNRYLVFEITNTHVIPDYASIDWTVRNDGEESGYLGDLGHASGGIGMFSTTEHTAYLGKHYMDCVVRCGGVVYSARRIVVQINPDAQLAVKNARLSWTKLRSRRGRRS